MEFNGTYRMLIGGEFVAGSATFDVINPATEDVVASAPDATQADLDAAVAAARKAFPGWAATPIEERKAKLNALGDAIFANLDGFMRLLTSEQGKPHAQARSEILSAAGLAKAQSTLKLEDEIIQDDDTRLHRHRRVPVGVVGGIVPLNFPVSMRSRRSCPR